jgi:hypothetical protein
MVSKYGHQDEDPFGKLGKRTRRLVVKYLENGVLDDVRCLDFRLLNSGRLCCLPVSELMAFSLQKFLV